MLRLAKIIVIYPAQANGAGRNHHVASVAQGKLFHERCLAVHKRNVVHAPLPSRHPLKPLCAKPQTKREPVR
jgi:hypothetical protein